MSAKIPAALPVPQINHNAHVDVQRTEQAFLQFAEKLSTMCSENHSLFANSIKLLHKSKIGYFNTSHLGSIMKHASPGWNLVHTVIHSPGFVAGVASYAYSFAQWVGVVKTTIPVPMTAQQQREHLTKLFIEKMYASTSTLPYNEQVYYKEHPKELIQHVTLSIAFLSRDLEAHQLKVGDDILKKEAISGQDETRKGYFDHICEMKFALQSLHLGPDNQLAWQHLMEAFEKPENNDVEQTLILLMNHAIALTDQLAKDEVFNRLWTESLHK